MKRLAILATLVCLLPLGISAQVAYPSGPVQPAMVPGDLITAVAGDVTIATATVTAASATGSGPYSVTYTMASVPLSYQIIGTKIGVTGALPSAYNVASAAVKAYTSTTVTISMASNPGTWTSGGTLFLAGQNAGNATSPTPFLNTFTIPANYWSSRKALHVDVPIEWWTGGTSANISLTVQIGGTTIYAAQGPWASIAASIGGQSGDMQLTILGVSPTQVMVYAPQLVPSTSTSGAFAQLNNFKGPITVTANAAQTLTIYIVYGSATAGNAAWIPGIHVW